jgi:hypothetical protein
LSSILPSSGLLRGVRWFETDVSGLPVGPIFKGQAVQEKRICYTHVTWARSIGKVFVIEFYITTFLYVLTNSDFLTGHGAAFLKFSKQHYEI